jgi:hypothetical protein
LWLVAQFPTPLEEALRAISGDFRSDLVFGEDGYVVEYPSLATF